MNKKMGPLKLWQWIAIGVAVGGAWYLYRKSHPEAANPEEIVGAVAGGVPSGGGGEGSGGVAGGSGGMGEAPGIPNIPEAVQGAIQEPGPFAEGLLAKIFATEAERRAGAQANARKAHREAMKAKHAQAKEHRARLKAEHRHTHKPKSTGGAAHVPHTHHTPPHPRERVGKAQVAKPPAKRRRGRRR